MGCGTGQARTSTGAQSHLSPLASCLLGGCPKIESPPNGPYGSSCFSSCCPHSLCLIFSIHCRRLHCLTRKSYLSFTLEWLNPWHIHPPSPPQTFPPSVAATVCVGGKGPAPVKGVQKWLEAAPPTGGAVPSQFSVPPMPGSLAQHFLKYGPQSPGVPQDTFRGPQSQKIL